MGNLDVRTRCPSQTNLLRGEKVSSATDFVDIVVTKHDDPLIQSYTWAFIGLCNRYQEKLASTDRKRQISVINLLYSATEGFSDDTSRIFYVDMDRRRCDRSTIAEKLYRIHREYKPGRGGSCDFVAVVGDQPVFKRLFEMWYASLRDGYGLCEWLILLPGGFHIGKQAMLALIKFCMLGAGLEAFLPVSGLSEYSQANFSALTHYRKNKRVVFHAVGASAIRLTSCAMSETPSLVDKINSLRDDGDVSNPYPSQVTLAKCKLRLTDVATPGILETGRLVYEAALELGNTFVTASFHMVNVVPSCLIPFTGYFVLQRSGKTDVSTPFWFYAFNILHATTKINYMELELYHGYVYMHMCEHRKEVLFGMREGHGNRLVPGATAINMLCAKDPGHGNLFADERHEQGINRVLKDIPRGRDVTSLEKSVHWVQEINQCFERLSSNLGISASRRSAGARDMDEMIDSYGVRSGYDREGRTAYTLAAMLKLMISRGWMGREHLRMERITNVLSNPHTEVRDRKAGERLLNIDEEARIKMRLHMHTRFSGEFGGLSERDITEYFGGKRPKGRTSKKRKVLNMEQLACEVGPESDVPIQQQRRKKRARRGDDVKLVSKRIMQILDAKSRLENTEASKSSSARRKSAAYGRRLAIKEIEQFSLLKYEFWKELQEEARTVLGNKFEDSSSWTFLRERWEAHPIGVRFVMKDMMNTVHVSPFSSFGCDDYITLMKAISACCRQELIYLLTGARGALIEEFHLFKDDPAVALPQKRLEQNRRDGNRCSTEVDRAVATDNAPCQRDTGTIQTKNGIIINLDGPCDFSLNKVVLGNRAEKDIMSSVFVFAAAKEAISLRPNITVFIHSCSAVVSDEVIGASPESLTFQRHSSGALIRNVTEGAEIVFDDASGESPTWIGGAWYIPSQCFALSNTAGLQRYPDGDSDHFEAETQIDFIIKAVLVPKHLERQECNAAGGGNSILVVSNDNDVPMILLLSEISHDVSITHAIGDIFLCIDKIVDVLGMLGVDKQHLCLAFGIGGSDLSSGTRGVAQKKYLQALIRFTRELTQVSASPAADAHEKMEYGWFIVITVLAYALTYSKKGKPFAPGEVSLGSREFHSEATGYKTHGALFYERIEDVENTKKAMNAPFVHCSCKGGCNSKRCSCYKVNEACLLCQFENCHNEEGPRTFEPAARENLATVERSGETETSRDGPGFAHSLGPPLQVPSQTTATYAQLPPVTHEDTDSDMSSIMDDGPDESSNVNMMERVWFQTDVVEDSEDSSVDL